MTITYHLHHEFSSRQKKYQSRFVSARNSGSLILIYYILLDKNSSSRILCHLLPDRVRKYFRVISLKIFDSWKGLIRFILRIFNFENQAIVECALVFVRVKACYYSQPTNLWRLLNQPINDISTLNNLKFFEFFKFFYSVVFILIQYFLHQQLYSFLPFNASHRVLWV